MLIQAQFRDLALGTCIPQRDPLFICPYGISYCDDTPLNVTLPINLNGTTCVTGDTVIAYLGFNNLEVILCVCHTQAPVHPHPHPHIHTLPHTCLTRMVSRTLTHVHTPTLKLRDYFPDMGRCGHSGVTSDRIRAFWMDHYALESVTPDWVKRKIL